MVWRFWKAVATAATLVALAAGALGCGGSRAGETQGVTPELKLEGARFRLYRGDTLRASGTAARVSLRRDSSELTASNLAAVLHEAADPAADVRIAAPEGHGVLRDRRFSASGGVTVARGGDVARTASARYEPSPGGGQVVGDEPVALVGEDYRLAGPGFVLDPRAGVITVRGGVKLDAARAGSR